MKPAPRFYSPNDPIQQSDIDAKRLTLEQCRVLINWTDWQACSTFEDSNGKQWPLQAILDAYHTSSAYDSFDVWYEEEPKHAQAAYNRILAKHKII